MPDPVSLRKVQVPDYLDRRSLLYRITQFAKIRISLNEGVRFGMPLHNHQQTDVYYRVTRSKQVRSIANRFGHHFPILIEIMARFRTDARIVRLLRRVVMSILDTASRLIKINRTEHEPSIGNGTIGLS